MPGDELAVDAGGEAIFELEGEAAVASTVTLSPHGVGELPRHAARGRVVDARGDARGGVAPRCPRARSA